MVASVLWMVCCLSKALKVCFDLLWLFVHEQYFKQYMLCTVPLLLPCPCSPCMRCQFNYSLKLQSVIQGCCQTSHKKPNNWHSAEHNKDRNQYSNIVKGHSSSVCLSFCRQWQQYGCHSSSLCIYFFIFWIKFVIQTGLPSYISCSHCYLWHVASCICISHCISVFGLNAALQLYFNWTYH